jgi:glycerophosphoryl diester phosphodiesterase
VHLTADGEPVVIHDAALERTTTGRGAVGDATLALLRALPLKARDGSVTTDTVPTRAKVLDLAAPTLRRRRGEGARVAAGAALRRAGDDPGLRRGDDPAAVRARSHPAHDAAGLSAQARDPARAEPPEAVRWASEVGASDVGIDYRTIDARVIAAAARPARVRLSAWTVNAEADLGRLLDLGVEVVMSDHPDLALSLAGHLPRKP